MQRKTSIWCRLLSLALLSGVLESADRKRCFMCAWEGIFTFTEERKTKGRPGWDWNASLVVQSCTPGVGCTLSGAQRVSTLCQAEPQEWLPVVEHRIMFLMSLSSVWWQLFEKKWGKPGPKRQGHSPFSMLEKNWGITLSSVRACLSENPQRKDLLLLPITILFLQSLEFPYTWLSVSSVSGAVAHTRLTELPLPGEQSLLENREKQCITILNVFLSFFLYFSHFIECACVSFTGEQYVIYIKGSNTIASAR